MENEKFQHAPAQAPRAEGFSEGGPRRIRIIGAVLRKSRRETRIGHYKVIVESL